VTKGPNKCLWDSYNGIMAVDASYFDGFGHVLRDDLRG
jgi:hypothetical protein